MQIKQPFSQKTRSIEYIENFDSLTKNKKLKIICGPNASGKTWISEDIANTSKRYLRFSKDFVFLYQDEQNNTRIGINNGLIKSHNARGEWLRALEENYKNDMNFNDLQTKINKLFSKATKINPHISKFDNNEILNFSRKTNWDQYSELLQEGWQKGIYFTTEKNEKKLRIPSEFEENETNPLLSPYYYLASLSDHEFRAIWKTGSEIWADTIDDVPVLKNEIKGLSRDKTLHLPDVELLSWWAKFIVATYEKMFRITNKFNGNPFNIFIETIIHFFKSSELDDLNKELKQHWFFINSTLTNDGKFLIVKNAGLQEEPLEEWYTSLSEGEKTTFSYSLFKIYALNESISKDIPVIWDDPFESFDVTNKHKIALNILTSDKDYKYLFLHDYNYINFLTKALNWETTEFYFTFRKSPFMSGEIYTGLPDFGIIKMHNSFFLEQNFLARLNIELIETNKKGVALVARKQIKNNVCFDPKYINDTTRLLDDFIYENTPYSDENWKKILLEISKNISIGKSTELISENKMYQTEEHINKEIIETFNDYANFKNIVEKVRTKYNISKLNYEKLAEYIENNKKTIHDLIIKFLKFFNETRFFINDLSYGNSWNIQIIQVLQLKLPITTWVHKLSEIEEILKSVTNTAKAL